MFFFSEFGCADFKCMAAHLLSCVLNVPSGLVLSSLVNNWLIILWAISAAYTYGIITRFSIDCDTFGVCTI